MRRISIGLALVLVALLVMCPMARASTTPSLLLCRLDGSSAQTTGVRIVIHLYEADKYAIIYYPVAGPTSTTFTPGAAWSSGHLPATFSPTVITILEYTPETPKPNKILHTYTRLTGVVEHSTIPPDSGFRSVAWYCY